MKHRLLHRKNLILIGLTGGIACGKTTVKGLFERLGAAVIDADAIAHDILTARSVAGKAAIRRYGENILDQQGELRRDAIGEIVFSDLREKRWLESITHPAITREINRRLSALSKKAGTNKRIVILDMPLLFEADFGPEFQKIIVVCSSRGRQYKRIRAQRKISTKNVAARIDAQWPLMKKKALADYVVRNDGSKKELEIKVKYLWKVLTKIYLSV